MAKWQTLPIWFCARVICLLYTLGLWRTSAVDFYIKKWRNIAWECGFAGKDGIVSLAKRTWTWIARQVFSSFRYAPCPFASLFFDEIVYSPNCPPGIVENAQNNLFPRSHFDVCKSGRCPWSRRSPCIPKLSGKKIQGVNTKTNKPSHITCHSMWTLMIAAVPCITKCAYFNFVLDAAVNRVNAQERTHNKHKEYVNSRRFVCARIFGFYFFSSLWVLVQIIAAVCA